MRPYFILSTHDDEAAVMANMAMRWSWWQLFLTTPGTIAATIVVLNGVLIGASLGTPAGGALWPPARCVRRRGRRRVSGERRDALGVSMAAVGVALSHTGCMLSHRDP